MVGGRVPGTSDRECAVRRGRGLVLVYDLCGLVCLICQRAKPVQDCKRQVACSLRGERADGATQGRVYRGDAVNLLRCAGL